MIHDRVASDAFRLVRIVGRATLTMVASSSDMNIPMSSTPSARQARRGVAPTLLNDKVVWDKVNSPFGTEQLRVSNDQGTSAACQHAVRHRHWILAAAPAER